MQSLERWPFHLPTALKPYATLPEERSTLATERRQRLRRLPKLTRSASSLPSTGDPVMFISPFLSLPNVNLNKSIAFI